MIKLLIPFIFIFFPQKKIQQMCISPQQNQKCQFKIQKQNYLRHLKRLERLKQGRSPDQIKREEESLKLSRSITNLRKMHIYNRTFQLKEQEETEKKNHFQNFNRVKSVVKESFCRPTPSIAPKHKVTLRPIIEENVRHLERILNVKTQYDFRKERRTERLEKRWKNSNCFDFTKFYESSRLNDDFENEFEMRLGKSKKFIKLFIRLEEKQLLKLFKDHESLYIFQASSGKSRDQSRMFTLSTIKNIVLGISISEKIYFQQNLQLRIKKVLDSKYLLRGIISLKNDELKALKEQYDLNQTTASIEKQIENSQRKICGKLFISLKFEELSKKEETKENINDNWIQ